MSVAVTVKALMPADIRARKRNHPIACLTVDTAALPP